MLELSSESKEGTQQLAIFGGSPAVSEENSELFRWPIITPEDEAAVLEVLRAGLMSGIGITQAFEREYAGWTGSKYALGFNNGTASLLAAMFAVGVGVGDEVICPATTYWASGLPAFSLGATLVFADIDPVSLCLDPNDLERRITPQTRAIVVVHYLGHPADMDAIMAVADRIVVLDQGRCIAIGSAREIQQNDAVLEAYLGRTQ